MGSIIPRKRHVHVSDAWVTMVTICLCPFQVHFVVWAQQTETEVVYWPQFSTHIGNILQNDFDLILTKAGIFGFSLALRSRQ
jgi:hypothetical protein